jgi:hypothetical protein
MRVYPIVVRQRHLCLGSAHLRCELLLLHVETGEKGLLLVELRYVQLQLCSRVFFVVLGLLDELGGAVNPSPEQITLRVASNA